MKAYWAQLNDREQAAVGGAGICFLLYLFYTLVYSPLVSGVVKGQADWVEKKTTVLWMQLATKAYAHEHAPKKVTTGNLLSVLTDLLEHASFQHFPYQLEQTATGDIQLTFTAVPYNAFVAWLQQQSKQYTLTIKHLYLSKTETSGVVKATVVFAVGV